ncbi:MAG: hypothetical protein ACP5OG_00420 [Candidatus Nanoarchaeia archaeon]
MDEAYLINVPGENGLYCLKNKEKILAYFRATQIWGNKEHYAISCYERIDPNKIDDGPEPIYYNKEDEYFYETTGNFLKLNGCSLEEKIIEYVDKSVNYLRLNKIKIHNHLSK